MVIFRVFLSLFDCGAKGERNTQKKEKNSQSFSMPLRAFFKFGKAESITRPMVTFGNTVEVIIRTTLAKKSKHTVMSNQCL